MSFFKNALTRAQSMGQTVLKAGQSAWEDSEDLRKAAGNKVAGAKDRALALLDRDDIDEEGVARVAVELGTMGAHFPDEKGVPRPVDEETAMAMAADLIAIYRNKSEDADTEAA